MLTSVSILLKQLLQEDLEAGAVERYTAALNAVRQMHREMAEGVLSQKLGEMVRNLPDERLRWAVRFLATVSDTWQYLPQDVRDKLRSYVAKMPPEQRLPGLLYALEVAPLHEAALQPLATVAAAELMELLRLRLRPEFIERAVTICQEAPLFDVQSFHLIRLLAEYLSPKQVEHLLESAARMPQNRERLFFIGAMTAIRSRSETLSTEQFDALLHQHGFADLIPQLQELRPGSLASEAPAIE